MAEVAALCDRRHSTIRHHLETGTLPHVVTAGGSRLVRVLDAEAHRDADLKPGRTANKKKRKPGKPAVAGQGAPGSAS